ncbi:MAG: FlgD immunoglobulin-like domain containing protein, partial [Candidatus Cloacimonetes bacterium]|nr:FlgD immunoglobulin-like domain containing protein [Candidatus Cloacimonadota bacterium]
GKGQAGNFSAIWDGKDDAGKQAASGVYLCRVITGNQSATRRMVLIR